MCTIIIHVTNTINDQMYWRCCHNDISFVFCDRKLKNFLSLPAFNINCLRSSNLTSSLYKHFADFALRWITTNNPVSSCVHHCFFYAQNDTMKTQFTLCLKTDACRCSGNLNIISFVTERICLQCSFGNSGFI